MKQLPETNLVLCAPDRRRRKAGEFFVLNFLNTYWVLGRVMHLKAKWAIDPLAGVNMLYFYRTVHASPVMEIPSYIEPDLLVEPLLTNNLGWTRGYFSTIGYRSILEGEMLRVNCFERQWAIDGVYVSGHPNAIYYDHLGARLNKRHEPCGVQVLHSYLTVDQRISKALGLKIIED